MIDEKIACFIGGEICYVDDTSLSILKSSSRKRIKKSGATNYVEIFTCPPNSFKKCWVPLHRAILCLEDKNDIVHHKDGNGLNNCKQNLRVCTAQQNAKGQKSRRSRFLYKGYDAYLSTQGGFYKSRITVDYKTIILGVYATEEDAAIAYDLASMRYFGDMGILNFPERNYNGTTIEEWMQMKSVRHNKGKKLPDPTENASLTKKQKNLDNSCVQNKKIEKSTIFMTVTSVARKLDISRANLYTLIKLGVFPEPNKTDKGRVFYDYEKFEQCLVTKRTGMGANGKPHFFYHRIK